MALNPKYRINLMGIFQRTFKSESSEVQRQLRSTLKSVAFKQTFSKMVIDEIIERTEIRGIDKKSVPFVKYSKSYINSDIFKIYAKDPSDINLHLTGEMLSSLTPNIGLESISIELIGDLNKAKAHGHINGIKRKDGTKAVRDFLGLPEDVESNLMREAMRIPRNPEFEAVQGFLGDSSLSDVFGQSGNQQGFTSSIFTRDILTLLARFYGNGTDS